MKYVCLLALAACRLYASPITYNYTGNEFTNFTGGWPFGGRVTASVTTDNGLITEWLLVGGSMYFSSYNPPCMPMPYCAPRGSASITVDANGNVTDWSIFAFNPGYGYNGGSAETSSHSGDYAAINNSSPQMATVFTLGVWTQTTVPNPEPYSAFLVLLGIALFLQMKKARPRSRG